MLGRYGETLVVDWVLAKALGERVAAAESAEDSPSMSPQSPLLPGSHSGTDPTQLGSALGTPAYMSPEQALGQHDLLGPASDIFSLGATLYQILTGRAPYVGLTASAIHDLACRCEFPPPRKIEPAIARP